MSAFSGVLIHHDLGVYVSHRFGIDADTISRDLASGWSEPLPAT